MAKAITFDCSIIIVNYRTLSLTIDCIKSICSSKTSFSYEIIVIDNNSEEDVQSLTAVAPFIQVIQLTKNVGFAAANNIGAKQARGECLLFLNSDTRVEENTLEDALSFLHSHKQYSGGTCKIMLPDGSLDYACHRGFPSIWASCTYFLGLERLFPHSTFFGQYHMTYLDINSIHPISVVSGAFLLIYKSVYDKLQGFDESFFMYGEDIDLCYRLYLAGKLLFYNPMSKIIHLKKQSGRLNQNSQIRKKTLQYFYATMLQFYNKHYKANHNFFVNSVVTAVIKFRLLIIQFFSR